MKKRILAITLVLCMLLPMIPFSTLALAPVEGLTYDSVLARDVVFGNVPISHWYEGLAGSEYQNGYDAGTHAEKTTYATYMTAFDKMVGFGDIVIDAGTVVSNGFDAEEWYNDIPADLVKDMNVTSTVYGDYITREILGKAHKSKNDIDSFVAGSNTHATRATEYIYAYTFDPTQEVGYVGPTNLPKMIINTGNQSDEKGSVFGTYYLLYDILNNWEKDPVLNYLRHNVKLVIVPCETPGGMNNGNTYWNANFVNINRNFDVNFKQIGGYTYVAAEGGNWNYDSANDAYIAVEEGTGAYTRYTDIDGLYSADGTNIKSNSQQYTQNSGLAPFDQSEACVLRDLIAKNGDAFYYTDFHTNTSSCLGLDTSGNTQWRNMNWQALGVQPDAYGKKLVNAANWHIDRMTENFVREYNLDQYGWTEGTLLGNITQSDGNGTSNLYVRSQNILSTTLEAISGFPRIPDGNGGSKTIYGGRYSPMTQKACSEVLGNWLIAILGEYAYNGNLSTDTYTTSFNSDMSGNYPTIENLPTASTGSYDTSVLPSAASKTYALSSLVDEKGNQLYPVTFNGNWQVGYKKINPNGSFNNNPDNFTPYGVYVTGASNTLFFSGDTTMYSTSGSIAINPSRGAGVMLSSTSNVNYGGAPGNNLVWGNDATIRYTAEYDGQITITVKDVLFNSNTSQFVVMKNGVKLGTIVATETSSSFVATGTGGWKSAGSNTALSDTFTTTVKAGDHIDFVNHNTNDIEGMQQLTYDNYETDSGKERARRGVKNYKISIAYTTSVITEIEADYSGKTDALSWTYPTNVNTLYTFLTWYDANGKAIANEGSLTGATAKINPNLISAGWIKSTDTWEQAIEGFFNYLRAQATVTSPSGWVVGAMEGDTPYVKGSNFSPINRYAIFKDGFNLFSVSASGTYERGYTDNKLGVSENYFEAQLAILKKAASLVTTPEQASEITIPYQASFATTLPTKGYMVGKPNSGNSGHSTAIAMLDFNENNNGNVDYLGTLLRPHIANCFASVSYTVPAAMTAGTATLSLNDLYYQKNTADHYFALYLVRGDTETALIPQCTVSSSTSAATIQEKLAELGSFEVKAGDRIDLRFGRVSNASFMTPNISLDIVQPGDKWEGNYGKENTFATSYETFFKWYDGATGDVIANNGTVTSDDYMLINPYFTAENATYKITADMTYREAIAVYKQYLRTLSKLVAKNNWQLVAMEGANAQVYGANLSPIKYADILERENAFALKITEATTGTTPRYSYLYTLTNGNGAYDNTLRSPDVWVSEGQFEIQMQLFFDEVYYDRSAKVFKNVENSAIAWDAKIGEFDAVGENGLTFDKISAYRTEGNVYNEYEVPYAWNSNGGNWSIAASLVAQSETNADYKGMVLRPQSGYGAGVMYTVPAGKSGAATLYIDQMYFGNWGSSTSLHNNSFTWNILVNGVEQFAEWQTSTENGDHTIETAADSARIQAINEALATLDLRVKAGDTVAFCVKFLSASIYVSPSIEITVTPDPEPLRRVQYASGGQVLGSVLATEGTSISDLLTAFKAGQTSYAANGCYVDGIWYDAGVELPLVGATNIIIDDFKLNTSASLTIGSTYFINVYLEAMEGATAAGVRIYGQDYPAAKQADGKWKVVVKEVYAKNLLDTAVAYVPYYTMQDGSERSSGAIVVRAAELLATYIGDEDEKVANLAQAALDYATVAKAYFSDGKITNAMKVRLEKQDAAILADSENMKVYDEVDTPYTFGAATLQLGDTVNFIFAITATGDADVSALANGYLVRA